MLIAPSADETEAETPPRQLGSDMMALTRRKKRQRPPKWVMQIIEMVLPCKQISF
jgi:hypothetical protein